jgi:hypothetical protein
MVGFLRQRGFETAKFMFRKCQVVTDIKEQAAKGPYYSPEGGK